ncbi:MAG: UDP-N-acetylmuramoyl-tripeptide--D-alanyl-D-alanine ligase [Halieaceae bacterium]|jgi:UDP-N-acetylmuramoyl-tripeptide--D-alanyl-D-alanine ligase|nr:UDP-N-acetylmuramoyl-tripeptide--D-alanyl-D-alanine ligase [Halieaceae bacterium]
MMQDWTLSELEQPLEGRLIGRDNQVKGVSTDSRKLNLGDLFVALRGDYFDGHKYLEQARAAGAAGAVVSSEVDAPLSVLRVTDTQQALGRLGALNRNAFSGPLVAITGSSGKTTVKNMIDAVLSQRGATLATRGNFNNEIGVPLTLLELAPEHQFAVIEMGAARIGDIAWLSELGRPSVAMLLNALPAHLESFGSVEQIAEAKGEILDGLGVDDIAIINADQPWANQWRARVKQARVIDFGLARAADVSATAIRSYGIDGISFTALTPVGDTPVRIQLPGLHNVANALAAVAAGLACELTLAEIRRGLELVLPVAGRLSVARNASGATIIDDCYNANPASVRAALDLLAECPGKRTLILGAMKELGSGSDHLHHEIGSYAKDIGVDQLIGVGNELRSAVDAFGAGGSFFADRDQAIEAVRWMFTGEDTVLVKGSRSAGMEVVLNALLVDPVGED